MFLSIWNCVHEISSTCIEAIVWLEDSFLDPHSTVSNKEFSVKSISNSSTILNITNHILKSFVGVWVVKRKSHCQMLFNVAKRSLEIRVVVFIWNAPSKWSELSSFLNN